MVDIKTIKELIDKHKEEINSNDLSGLYEEASDSLFSSDYGYLSYILYDSGIDPMTYLTDYPFDSLFAYADIEKVTIPGKVKYVESFMFNNCEKLQQVNMEHGVERIGLRAFYKCYELETIKFPNTLNRIENQAFMRCYSIEKLNLPESLRSIADEAFHGCDALSKIHMYPLDFIGALVFDSDNIEIKFEGTIADWNKMTKSKTYKTERTKLKIIAKDGSLEE